MHAPLTSAAARSLLVMACAMACALGGAGLRAQPVTAPVPVALPAAAPGADDAALLQAFGQAAGLQRLADDFVERLRRDARIGHFFKDTQPAHLKKQLATQFCQLMNGPCEHDGETMKNSHAELKIGRKDFLALVEVLQDTMDAQGIPFRAQNRLLARLAPMHRDIITVP